jgi:hypothetical protein
LGGVITNSGTGGFDGGFYEFRFIVGQLLRGYSGFELEAAEVADGASECALI